MFKLIVILVAALLLEAVGVVFLSKGLKEVQGMQGFSCSEIVRVVVSCATNGHFLLGLLMETVFFVALLYLLKMADVSLIWPLTSLGFVLTTLAAKYIRHEDVSAVRWSGVFLIMAGAALVGYSERLKSASTTVPPAANVTR